MARMLALVKESNATPSVKRADAKALQQRHLLEKDMLLRRYMILERISRSGSDSECLPLAAAYSADGSSLYQYKGICPNM